MRYVPSMVASMFMLALMACGAEKRGESTSWRLLALEALPREYVTAKEDSMWLEHSRKGTSSLDGLESKRYREGKLERVWRIPASYAPREGVSILEGVWTDAPDSEVSRRDFRVFVVLEGPKVAGKVYHVNAYPRTLAILRGEHVGGFYLLFLGSNWRGGSHFSIVEWRLGKAEGIREIWRVEGEEETDFLSFEFVSGSESRLTLLAPLSYLFRGNK